MAESVPIDFFGTVPGVTWEIAILGDLHGSWDDRDADYFNRSDYAMLLFTATWEAAPRTTASPSHAASGA